METSKHQHPQPLGVQVFVALTMLTLIKENGRTGTLEIQQRLIDRGAYLSLRSIQRWLRTAEKNGIPITCDNSSPRGWWWKKEMTADEVAMVETINALREAA